MSTQRLLDAETGGVGEDASGYASDDDDDVDDVDVNVHGESRVPVVARTSTWRGFTARTTSLWAGDDRDVEDEDEDEGVESLDSNDVDSHWSRRSAGKTRGFAAKWIVTGIIGCSIGVIAFALDVAVSFAFRVRRALFRIGLEHVHVVFGLTLFAVSGVLLTLCASVLTVYVAPAAKGAGMAYVMSFLNGVHVPRSLDTKTLVAKWLGVVCSVSSGLIVGPEGPLVHMGTAVAAWFTRGRLSGVVLRRRFDVDLFASDEERNDFLCAGVAAGLAAAFGSPVGGVLFALEEASTHWSKESTTHRALFAATLATFILALCRAKSSSQYTSMTSPGLLVIGDVSSTYYLIELPFFALLAACCGVVSGVLTRTIVLLSRITAPRTNRRRVAQALMTSSLCTSIFYVVAFVSGTCKPMESPDVQAWHEEVGMRLWCKSPDEYNDVGSVLLSNHNGVLTWILGAPDGAFSLKALIYCFVTTLFGLCAAANLYVPAGLFMPTILWGAISGRAASLVIKHSFASLGEISLNPHAYAIVGATAALAGTFRGASISVVIIMFEGTGTHAFLLPCLVAVAMSNVFSSFGGSVYAEQLRAADIPFLHQEPPKSLDPSLTVGDICSREVVCFSPIERVGVIEHALETTRHNGFPIVATKSKRVIGLILRKQLLVLLSRRAFIENMIHLPTIAEEEEDERADANLALHHNAENEVAQRRIAEYCKELSNLMRTYHQRRDGDVARAASTRAARAIGLTESERAKRCDLAVFMHVSPVCLRADVSVAVAWVIFSRLRLRHLPIVGGRGDTDAIVGVVTRRDFTTHLHS